MVSISEHQLRVQWDGNVIVVELNRESRLQKNDLVFINSASAPDGQYKTGMATAILVENGKIKKVLSFM